MAKKNDIGVFRLDNGFWGYRFSIIVTQLYYLAVTKTGVDVLRTNLDLL